MFKIYGLDKNIGLGKHNTGIKEPIKLSSQKGRAGLGSKTSEVDLCFWLFNRSKFLKIAEVLKHV